MVVLFSLSIHPHLCLNTRTLMSSVSHFFFLYSAPGKEVLRLSSLPLSAFSYISIAGQFVALGYAAAVGKVQQ